ncbi:hypothetical protein L195_g046794, partial [Trifolium pratense]
MLQIHSHNKLMLPLFRPLSSSSISQAVVTVQDQQQLQKPQLRSSQLVALEYADLNLSYNL